MLINGQMHGFTLQFLKHGYFESEEKREPIPSEERIEQRLNETGDNRLERQRPIYESSRRQKDRRRHIEELGESDHVAFGHLTLAGQNRRER